MSKNQSGLFPTLERPRLKLKTQRRGPGSALDCDKSYQGEYEDRDNGQ